MSTKAGKDLSTVWIKKGLHGELKELAAASKRTIRDTVEIALLYGMPNIKEEIERNRVLSKKHEERSFDDLLSQE